MACGSSALRIISSSAKLVNPRSQYTSSPTNIVIPIKLSNPSLTDIHPSLLDLVLTYLLISASSAAATRVYDWQPNWGKDKFPGMASASVGLSFVAFVAFALSSLFSGYTLFKTS